jgi:hypothetical protein
LNDRRPLPRCSRLCGRFSSYVAMAESENGMRRLDLQVCRRIWSNAVHEEGVPFLPSSSSSWPFALLVKAGHGPAPSRPGPSRTRSFSARLGLARFAGDLRKWARPELGRNSVRLASQAGTCHCHVGPSSPAAATTPESDLLDGYGRAVRESNMDEQGECRWSDQRGGGGWNSNRQGRMDVANRVCWGAGARLRLSWTRSQGCRHGQRDAGAWAA